MDSKTAGLTNRPLQAFAKNQIWLELACLAYELLKSTSAHVYVRQRIRLRAHLDMSPQFRFRDASQA